MRPERPIYNFQEKAYLLKGGFCSNMLKAGTGDFEFA